MKEICGVLAGVKSLTQYQVLVEWTAAMRCRRVRTVEANQCCIVQQWKAQICRPYHSLCRGRLLGGALSGRKLMTWQGWMWFDHLRF